MARRYRRRQTWNLLDPDVLRWLLERKFSLELLAQFTEVRLAVEPMAAMLAASKATPAGMAEIRDAIERMRAAARGEDDPLESDIAFHVAVLDATGNRFYAQLEGVIDAALRTSILFTNRSRASPSPTSTNIGKSSTPSKPATRSVPAKSWKRSFTKSWT